MTTFTLPAETSRGLALVVDDLPANRKMLEALLKIEGFRTILAEDGEQAVRLFREHQPDIVFMDVMMPVMDGYEATRAIKAMANSAFIPVIFLTAMSEGEALVKCIEAGGDEFLGKPFKQEILGAKIKAMMRIRELSLKVAQQNDWLMKEQVIAEQIYSRAVTGDNIATKYIASLLRPVSIFSGDLLLTADSPNGEMHILLGDFTGHGLSAAVGVLPTADVFRAMTAKGFAAPEILSVINAKLHRLLPTGMFLTACFVEIGKDMRSVSIWNAGMPEALVLGTLPQDESRSQVKHRVVSKYLPLGILSEVDRQLVPVQLDISAGDRILLCSDGVTEAINPAGEVFGMARYEEAATETRLSFAHVTNALEQFCGKQPFRDDVSLVEIQCVPGLLKAGALDIS